MRVPGGPPLREDHHVLAQEIRAPPVVGGGDAVLRDDDGKPGGRRLAQDPVEAVRMNLPAHVGQTQPGRVPIEELRDLPGTAAEANVDAAVVVDADVVVGRRQARRSARGSGPRRENTSRDRPSRRPGAARGCRGGRRHVRGGGPASDRDDRERTRACCERSRCESPGRARGSPQRPRRGRGACSRRRAPRRESPGVPAGSARPCIRRGESRPARSA